MKLKRNVQRSKGQRTPERTGRKKGGVADETTLKLLDTLPLGQRANLKRKNMN